MKAKQAGFTLIEVMVAVVVLSVLLSIGVPNFRDFIRNARLSAAANDFISATNLARAEAIKRNRPASVCSRTLGEDTCDDGGDFRDGWLVFVDLDADGDIDDDDEILDTHGALPDSIQRVTVTEPGVDPDDEDTVVWSASDVSVVTYATNGFRTAAAGGLPGSIAVTFCDARNNVVVSSSDELMLSAARTVDVSALGRVQALRDYDAIDLRKGCAE